MTQTVGTTLQPDQSPTPLLVPQLAAQITLQEVAPSVQGAPLRTLKLPLTVAKVTRNVSATTYSLGSYSLGALSRRRGRADQKFSLTVWIPGPGYSGSEWAPNTPDVPYLYPADVFLTLLDWMEESALLTLTTPFPDYPPQVQLDSLAEDNSGGQGDRDVTLTFSEYRALVLLTTDEASIPNQTPGEQPGISPALTGQSPQSVWVIPKTYETSVNDTLSRISRIVYQDDGSGWQLIYDANRSPRGPLGDPNVVPPGVFLTIPGGGTTQKPTSRTTPNPEGSAALPLSPSDQSGISPTNPGGQ